MTLCSERFLGFSGRVAQGAIYFCLLLFLISKPIEVHYEPSVLRSMRPSFPTNWTPFHTVGYGVIRRIDDARFWIIAGFALTFVRLRRVVKEHDLSDRQPAKGRMILGIALASIYAVATTWIYIATARTFQWGEIANLKHWTQPAIDFVTKLQFIEGCINLMAIGAISLVVLYGASVFARTQEPTDTRLTTQVFAAYITPLVAAPVYFGIVTILIDAALVKFGHSATHPFEALGYTICYGWPFLVLAALTAITWASRLDEVDPIEVLKNSLWDTRE